MASSILKELKELPSSRILKIGSGQVRGKGRSLKILTSDCYFYIEQIWYPVRVWCKNLLPAKDLEHNIPWCASKKPKGQKNKVPKMKKISNLGQQKELPKITKLLENCEKSWRLAVYIWNAEDWQSKCQNKACHKVKNPLCILVLLKEQITWHDLSIFGIVGYNWVSVEKICRTLFWQGTWAASERLGGGKIQKLGEVRLLLKTNFGEQTSLVLCFFLPLSTVCFHPDFWYGSQFCLNWGPAYPIWGVLYREPL